MRMVRLTIAALGLSLAAGSGIAAVGGADEETSATAMPGRGSTMQDVETRYGRPSNVVPAVGQPPITRWVYDSYTVYFENDRVIHAVSNEKRPRD